MINFYNTLSKGKQLLFNLFVFLIFSQIGLAQQQASGSTYCIPDGSSVTLESNSAACSAFPDWSLELQDFCLASPSCASQQGLFQFILVSNYEMSNVTICLENSLGGIPLTPNFEDVCEVDFYNVQGLQELLVEWTTNDLDNDNDGFVDNSLFGTTYSIRINATIAGCSNTDFFIPENTILCSEQGACIGSISENGYQSFEIPSDYDPVSFDYTLDMPACFGQPALFTANGVSGGGCTDASQMRQGHNH
jgi:hypothetical protein